MELDPDTAEDAPASPFVRIDNLRAGYGSVLALDGLDLTVGRSEFVCVCGPSGCGKSTMMQVLSGLLPPTSGRVTVGGSDIDAVRDTAAGRIGYVFQDHRLLPWRTVRQNLEIVLRAAHVARDLWDERIQTNLTMLGIDRFENSWPMQLSGGQRQRVAVARALVIEPALVLMDEPFSGLDEVTARVLRGEILSVWAQTNTAVVFVTHSIREAAYLSDRIVILTPGPGRVLQTFTNPLPRPRDHESIALAEFEREIVDVALAGWGMDRK